MRIHGNQAMRKNRMTEDMNEEADAEEFTFVLTDEWKDKAASKKDGYTLGEPSMYERKTDKLVGHDNFDTNAISDKPVVVELWLVNTGVLPIENFLDGNETCGNGDLFAVVGLSMIQVLNFNI
ncbi:hypothetical protein Tco_0089996 [Tanacetum coccineum]